LARIGLSASKAESVSRTIRDAVAQNKIKIADPEQSSLRYRRYIPYWA